MCTFVWNVQGNSTTKKSVSDVVTRQRQNRDKTINITVQKRNNVDWNYVVDSSGNKTTVGLWKISCFYCSLQSFLLVVQIKTTNEVFSTTLQCNDSVINIDMFWIENKRTPLTGGIVVEVSNAVSIIDIQKYIFIQKDCQIILSSESEADICMLNLTPYSEDSIRISNINAPIFYVKSDSLVLYKKKWSEI